MQTIGPRFETKAEIRILSTFGDIVGMTSYFLFFLFFESDK